MQTRIYLNEGWKFAEAFSTEQCQKDFDVNTMIDVRIPHTVKELEFNYIDEESYQMISGYRRVLYGEPEWAGKKIFLTFEGAAHVAEVFLNGKSLAKHNCGYTAFTVDLTADLILGEENILNVCLNSREDSNVPPFGYVVDYLTYGGIYRDVYLEVKERMYISDVFVQPKLPETFVYQEKGNNLSNGELVVDVTLEGEGDGLFLRGSLIRYGTEESPVGNADAYVKMETLSEGKTSVGLHSMHCSVSDVAVWDVESPALYLFRVELLREGEVLECKDVVFGFRKAEFKKDGFYLNGRKFKIRGLNRHQSYPYVGYAMPKNLQRYDGDILKKELSLNAVRTSHYPQSHAFIDRCDELGLLVFMEFPGWQHIGDETWKEQACKNAEEMILQYRNHTSIIIWGVRINESQDDNAFYEKTNAIAHKLDPSRPTGGVRAHKKSHLFEDVYTYNDFYHDGTNDGCEPKQNVTSNMEAPYLITEYNGHMFPTKNADPEEHRVEHLMRHYRVLDAVAGQADISGSFGWCMFDYNTHKDFGSGDHICYHGVMDMFRNPKLASYAYTAQEDHSYFLELSSSMDIGEHPACNRGDTWILTNADSVRMYKNDIFIKEYKGSDSPFKNLKHGPILVDDFIGNQIHENENFTKKQADQIKLALNTTARKGMGGLGLDIKWIAVKMMVFYHMKPEQAVVLYNKYIGDWGGQSTEYRFEAIVDGKVVATITKVPPKTVDYEIKISHTELKEEEAYDVAAVRIRAVDEHKNQLPFYEEPILLRAEGAIEIVGPKVIPFRGGMTGTYVRTKGEAGEGTLWIEKEGMEPRKVTFSVHK